MNGWEETDSILVFFFECYMYLNGIDKYDKLFEFDGYFHFEMLAKIVDFNIEDLIAISYGFSNEMENYVIRKRPIFLNFYRVYGR